MSVPLQHAFDQPKDLFQRSIQPGRILPAGLRHLGPAAAGPTDFRRHLLDEVACFQSGNQILRHDDQQRDLAVVGGAESHDTALQLVPQLIGQRPHAVHIQTIRPLHMHLDTGDGFRRGLDR